jgi:hypothetical protein
MVEESRRSYSSKVGESIPISSVRYSALNADVEPPHSAVQTYQPVNPAASSYERLALRVQRARMNKEQPPNAQTESIYKFETYR